ncbi:tetratricopeptide repeat domain protein [Rhodobacteraceae bacterium KLH11]|nr:tetratricopeptide repeat domain protein [Rhodobacteraceae bacterium KLH11]
MTRTRGVFIGQRKDRMGARLLMILTCIRLAEDFRADYRVNWFPQGADAPELDQPQELFTSDWMGAHFLDQAEFDACSQTALPIWAFQNDPSPERLEAHLASGRSVLVEEGFEVLAFPWEDIETIRPRYRDFIRRIGFVDDIRQIMDRADEAISGQGVSAYHIRRGDILNGLPWKHSTWPAKIEPEELYEAHLQKSEGKAAIMFSDQPELIARFKKRFPQLLQMSDIADLSELTRAQRDFLELYTMSRAEQVIAPFISAFSMAAARISGHQRKVFRDVLSEAEMQKANTRVIERVAQGPEAFLNPSEAAHIYSKAVQYLSAQDRCEEAYASAKPILKAGADNAFMPLLQSLNCFYLAKWQESETLAKDGLQNPHLWPEDYAVLCALRGAILGAQNKRWAATRHFAKAFWAKPLRPDVVVLGSRMLYRDQLTTRLLPPVDWSLQRVVRQRRFPPFNNLYLVQHKVVSWRPCNFDFILLDWSELALDQRARRLFDHRKRLEALETALGSLTDLPPDDPRLLSARLVLQRHLGQVSGARAIDLGRKLVADLPENTLYLKRLATLYEAEGDAGAASQTMAEALACDPENPFLLFAMGRLLERMGKTGRGEALILQAADADDVTVAIQGMAGQIHMRRGNKNKARPLLEKARELYPPYKRFSNQLKRIAGQQ